VLVSIHLAAERGQIAPIVLMPGDPLRAQRIAGDLFGPTEPYSRTRNMFGFTGMANVGDDKQIRVSVQGSGMGIPSIGIYATELFDEYDVETIIRVGTCGAMREDMNPGDLVIAGSASTDSSFIPHWFGNSNFFAPSADPGLFVNAVLVARDRGWKAHVGGVLSTDIFYDKDHPEAWRIWPNYGILAVEMETAMLYTLAARRRRRTLSVLVVSDNLVTGARMSAEERETCFPRMVELALASVSAERV